MANNNETQVSEKMECNSIFVHVDVNGTITNVHPDGKKGRIYRETPEYTLAKCIYGSVYATDSGNEWVPSYNNSTETPLSGEITYLSFLIKEYGDGVETPLVVELALRCRDYEHPLHGLFENDIVKLLESEKEIFFNSFLNLSILKRSILPKKLKRLIIIRTYGANIKQIATALIANRLTPYLCARIKYTRSDDNGIKVPVLKTKHKDATKNFTIKGREEIGIFFARCSKRYRVLIIRDDYSMQQSIGKEIFPIPGNPLQVFFDDNPHVSIPEPNAYFIHTNTLSAATDEHYFERYINNFLSVCLS